MRKLRELLYAVEMERTLGKRRILALYLAVAPWGDGVCGGSQAARHHFGKPARELDAIEVAWLASLLRDPRSPVDDAQLAFVLNGMKAAAKTRQRWIEQAAQREFPPLAPVTPSEADAASP